LTRSFTSSTSRTFIIGLIISAIAFGLFSGAILQKGSAPAPAEPTFVPVPPDEGGSRYKRFLTLNERVQQRQGDPEILFLGDSITQDWEITGRMVWDEYYEGRALNLGVGGDRTQNVLWRLENGNIDGLSPRVAVVLIGVNNSGRNTSTEILQGVTAVVAKLREKLPETKILLLGIFPHKADFHHRRGLTAQVNQVLPRLADGENVFFLDIGHRFLADDGTIPDSIMPDELHLSEAGYRIWAEAMEEPLNALLLGRPLSFTHR
jgi:lysophospholipase L1-like esterase